MPKETGVWAKSEVAGQHCFSHRLAEWVAGYLPKDYPLLDFGCGLGTYSKYFRDVGFQNVTAIEGEDLEELFETEVVVHDLTHPLPAKYRGNIYCTELGEHIPGILMDKLLDNITECCTDKLVLSWAIRGQDGFSHVNCLDNYEVIGIMQDRGFKFLWGPTREARSVIEDFSCQWFKNTLLVFKKL